MVFRDLTGKKFGNLTVIKRAENKIQPNGTVKTRWLCKCDYGNECVVHGANLKSLHTTSCGCYHSQKTSEFFTKHGSAGSKLYIVWCGMKNRCYNKNVSCYKRYGGRGISVCKEWRNNFSLFKEWAMKNGYKTGLSIERINNDGNYCPENCKWATRKEQMRNYSKNHNITYNGITLCLADWEAKCGLTKNILYKRIKRGWTEEEALSVPQGMPIKKYHLLQQLGQLT